MQNRPAMPSAYITQVLDEQDFLETEFRFPMHSAQSLTEQDYQDYLLGIETVAEQVEIQLKYEGYIERQKDEIAKQQHHETYPLPSELDYTQVIGLSTEVKQKLSAARPATLGMAARIPGVTPAALSLLLVHLKKQKRYADST